MRTPARVYVTGESPWRGLAQCRREHAAAFFPPPHFELKEDKDAREDQARALCQACPVQQDCLDYSLAVQEPHGIWGGLNELERRRLIRKRGLAQRSA
jgi:WhiB family redox-sensing transcriptional regulator